MFVVVVVVVVMLVLPGVLVASECARTRESEWCNCEQLVVILFTSDGWNL